MSGMLERSARIAIGEERPEALTASTLGQAAPAEEVADGVVMIESFSNVVAVNANGQLVLFDVSHALSAPAALEELRKWSSDPVDTAVYTHGHVDHVTGAGAFDADAQARRNRPITYVGHDAVLDRMDRYELTAGYNGHINMRQFRLPAPMWPSEFVRPSVTYRDTMMLDVGDEQFHLHHARGETDDHTWVWMPERRAVCVGDLFIWQFPNAGNPQKVQRYAWDWVVALRAMADLSPELMLPAHGPALAGADLVTEVLRTTADALASLHEQTLALMNDGATLDEVIHTVRLPDRFAGVTYLLPTYDEPEFVVRNLWRLYGGWYDGNPAHLKPAPDAALASEIATLTGGAATLAERAERLAADGELRLACHLVEMAVAAEPDSRPLHAIRARIYDERRAAEQSFMATGIFRAAALDSRRRAETD